MSRQKDRKTKRQKDKKTKRQKDKKSKKQNDKRQKTKRQKRQKRQKDKKTKRQKKDKDKDQRECIILRRQGSSALLRCFSLHICLIVLKSSNWKDVVAACMHFDMGKKSTFVPLI